MNSFPYKAKAGLLYLLLFVLIASCSKKLMFERSTVVPAAEGSVKYKKDKNKNYRITVKVLHLAHPDKLMPTKAAYVVWMETQYNGVKNLGQLKSSRTYLKNT